MPTSYHLLLVVLVLNIPSKSTSGSSHTPKTNFTPTSNKMKLASLLAASVMAGITAVEGCVRVHTQMNYNILTGDIMQVEIWDNNNFYCQTGGKKTFTNNQARWFFTCSSNGETWEVELWNDGKAGYVRRQSESPVPAKPLFGNLVLWCSERLTSFKTDDGWNSNLSLKSTKSVEDCIAYGGKNDSCRIKGELIESCSTAADDCGGWTCKMCDFRGICGR